MDGASSCLELGGRIECTVNRVGDNYYTQLEGSGHAWRIDDLDRLAALRIRPLRQRSVVPNKNTHASQWIGKRHKPCCAERRSASNSDSITENLVAFGEIFKRAS